MFAPPLLCIIVVDVIDGSTQNLKRRNIAIIIKCTSVVDARWYRSIKRSHKN